MHVSQGYTINTLVQERRVQFLPRELAKKNVTKKVKNVSHINLMENMVNQNKNAFFSKPIRGQTT